MLQRHVVLHTQIIGDSICQVNVRMSDLSKVQKCFWLNPNSLISLFLSLLVEKSVLLLILFNILTDIKNSNVTHLQRQI